MRHHGLNENDLRELAAKSPPASAGVEEAAEQIAEFWPVCAADKTAVIGRAGVIIQNAIQSASAPLQAENLALRAELNRTKGDK